MLGTAFILPARTVKCRHRHTYGYIRVSEDEQDQEHLSPGNQEKRIKQYALKHKLDFIRTFTDENCNGITMDDRPALKQLLAILKPGDTVIFDSIRRITVDKSYFFRFFAKLTKAKIYIVFIERDFDNRDPFGESLTKIFLDMAETENQTALEKAQIIQTETK